MKRSAPWKTALAATCAANVTWGFVASGVLSQAYNRDLRRTEYAGAYDQVRRSQPWLTNISLSHRGRSRALTTARMIISCLRWTAVHVCYRLAGPL